MQYTGFNFALLYNYKNIATIKLTFVINNYKNLTGIWGKKNIIYQMLLAKLEKNELK